ncbi:MAG: BamA/TamA family outer membrane protein [Prolixibacteraceae bacterium]|nr:BamA/TamA family outer membrane protein [Prolixibacteraceae bacterium]
MKNILFLILISLLFAACTGTRHLPEGEKLYTGAEIKLESTEAINRSFVKSVVQAAVRPLPNKSYLGLRPKLWKYNTAGENPQSKFKKWLQRTGEPPVLLSSVKTGATSAIIDAKLFNIGIFNSFTESKIVEKKHTAKVIYTSHIHKPYLVKDMVYAILNDSISRLILTEKDKSLIKPGEEYNLDQLKNERIRIDGFLKNNGYFYFNPDYLLFKADTSTINHNVTFKLTLKDSIPKNALTVFRINNVYVNQNYSLNERRVDFKKDTLIYENVVFLGKEARMAIRPKVLSKSIYLRKNEIFSRQNHSITLNRLMSMGNFKLVQINFSENTNAGPGLLDVNILMTPMPKHTFRAEIDMVSKSNNYTGPRMNLSILNRNAFGGAELLNLTLAGAFETQLSGNNKNQFSYSYNPQLELTFPRFLVPFNIKRTSSIYIPKTRLLLSYNYMKRVDYFDLRTFQFIYGFKWKENIRKEHELNPIDVSFTKVANQSAAFTALLNANPFLGKSYQEQFIAGGSYSFSYNEQVIPGKKMQYYARFTSELAGNVFSLAKAIGGEKVSAANSSKVAGSIYSQFGKMSIDARGFYNFKDKNKLALRFYAGIAKPFGNSSILPYSKQFFSGGPNSLRAFQINSVGPGTYDQKHDTLGILQLGGDIKLETNAEYRFGIYRYFKGALFVDAGNVWLLQSNPSKTGTPFVASKFLNEVAVGAGVGLRVDVSFFILRFDLAFPLRKVPEFEDNFRWVANRIDFTSSTWRKDNLVLNVAIGYPF